MLLHGGHLLQGKTQGVYHEYTFRNIDIINVVELKCNYEKDEQDEEAMNHVSLR